MIYPISFSIPTCKIVDTVPYKTQLYATIVPGEVGKPIYLYTNEAEYYNGYKTSVFGKTRCKGGWDCLRHYEILANGCIPWFDGIENCPPNTMTHFPKQLVKEAMETIGSDVQSTQVQEYCQKLLNYTREHLSTKAMASYVFRTINKPSLKSVLYLSSQIEPDYLRCLTLIGCKELLAKQCHDYPCINHIYTSCGESAYELYGKGMSYTNILDKSSHRDDAKDLSIEADITNHAYDIVIYGSIHRGMPFWDLVNKHYASSEIVLFCGEDLHGCGMKYLGETYHLFVREL